MVSLVQNKKMSVSKATSTLIGLILKMPPKDIMDTLDFVEHRKMKADDNAMTEVVFAVENRLFKGVARSIDARGMFVQTPQRFHPGESITLSFENRTEGRHVKTQGRIISLTEEGIGVVFDRANDQETV